MAKAMNSQVFSQIQSTTSPQPPEEKMCEHLSNLQLAANRLRTTGVRVGIFVGMVDSYEDRDDALTPAQILKNVIDLMEQMEHHLDLCDNATTTKLSTQIENNCQDKEYVQISIYEPSANALVNDITRKAVVSGIDYRNDLNNLTEGLTHFFKMSKIGACTADLIGGIYTVGAHLYTMMNLLNFDSSALSTEADVWAQLLNREGRGRFQIFLVHTGDKFDTELMTGGIAYSAVHGVKSWGVKNNRGRVQFRAIVA